MTLPELVKRDPSPEELLALLQELEFRSMQAKLFGKKAPEARKSPLPADDLFAPAQAEQPPAEAPAAPAADARQNGSGQMDLFEERHLKTVDDFKHEYIIADTEEARSAMVAELEKHDSWCFDTETTGLNPLTDKLLGVAFWRGTAQGMVHACLRSGGPGSGQAAFGRPCGEDRAPSEV